MRTHIQRLRQVLDDVLKDSQKDKDLAREIMDSNDGRVETNPDLSRDSSPESDIQCLSAPPDRRVFKRLAKKPGHSCPSFRDVVSIRGAERLAWRTRWVAGDGRCQFRAFANAVWGEDHPIDQFLEEIAAVMRGGLRAKGERLYKSMREDAPEHEKHKNYDDAGDGDGHRFWSDSGQ
ncbi:hypothetical protein B9479_007898 [Cryptococcus floricola]|uniref:OTU domain-containing protein n=1 Tax=Cryptococcus floricola TaxID=2591691 RepID=A0A5D3AL68_9TREE|nr:hypothetical protein B9479_007898 [Cryptococcus floricola]